MSELLEPLECPIPDVASVPRRFGVGVLMILVTAFAVLFSVMRTFGAWPEIFVIVAVLFLSVTLGQILLFQGKQPRKASIWIGGVVFPIEILALKIVAGSRVLTTISDIGNYPPFAFVMLLGVIPGGTLWGYLAGCVMAGVFLVQERFRRGEIQPVTIGLLPFTTDDFDTLIYWVREAELFYLWSGGRFHFPLDREQLTDYFGLTSSEPAERLCFKAVCGEMQQMVAFAVLAQIDREKLRARIDLAVVDPSRNDRGDLSNALIREMMQQAFRLQGLTSLGVVLRYSDVQSEKCFRKNGFYDSRVPSDEAPAYQYQMLICRDKY